MKLAQICGSVSHSNIDLFPLVLLGEMRRPAP
jgi:hypothetical protein